MSKTVIKDGEIVNDALSSEGKGALLYGRQVAKALQLQEKAILQMRANMSKAPSPDQSAARKILSQMQKIKNQMDDLESDLLDFAEEDDEED